MESIPRHAKKDFMRGTIKISDFRPSNLHPKTKLRIGMALFGTFLLIFGCVYMLSTTVITFDPDLSTSAGVSAMLRNLVAIGYIMGTIVIILILWYLMIKDCPLSPAAKWNYESSHDNSLKGVKVIAAMTGAIASKGSGSSIDSVANALNDYFEVDKVNTNMQEKASINPKVRS